MEPPWSLIWRLESFEPEATGRLMLPGRLMRLPPFVFDITTSDAIGLNPLTKNDFSSKAM